MLRAVWVWGVTVVCVRAALYCVCAQVEFRQQSRQAAEITKLATRERIDEATLQSTMKVGLSERTNSSITSSSRTNSIRPVFAGGGT
jgi:hypothetical protein